MPLKKKKKTAPPFSEAIIVNSSSVRDRGSKPLPVPCGNVNGSCTRPVQAATAGVSAWVQWSRHRQKTLFDSSPHPRHLSLIFIHSAPPQ